MFAVLLPFMIGRSWDGHRGLEEDVEKVEPGLARVNVG